MHNPITNSGGVMVGTVKQIGKEAAKRGFSLKVGDKIIPVASLSCIPLMLQEISFFHGDLVGVKGFGILSSTLSYAKPPEDMNLTMALASLDVSRAVPLVENTTTKLLKMNPAKQITVFVIGCGKAGITTISCLKTRFGRFVRVLAVDVNPKMLHEAQQFIHPEDGDIVEKLNARYIPDVIRFINKHTQGIGAELSISCVNVNDVEQSAILATKKHGVALFFSMATQFDKAALGTDAVSKDIDVMIGAGVCEDQVDRMFNLMREDKKLWKFLEHETQPQSKL